MKTWSVPDSQQRALEPAIAAVASHERPAEADEPVIGKDRAAAAPWVDSKGDVADPAADKRPTLDPIKSADPEIGSPEWRSQIARTAANAKHDLPGGSRDKQGRMRSLWASGNYSSRDVCAEQECSALEMSFATARKALVNTPDPTRS